MAILVTGGAGYIGSHMVWCLLDAHEDVVVLDRLSTGFRWAVAPEAKFYEGDIGDSELMSRIFASHDIEAIIHFAGSVVVPESVADPLTYYENNTVKSRALIEAAVRAQIKYFVFSSTAAVYGTPDGEGPVNEAAPLRPESPYGSSKLMTEIMLKDVGFAHDITYTVLRYFNVAGADVHGRTGQSTAGATHLIKVACEAALGKRHGIDVYGVDYPTPDGTCIRDFIHVTDLANAHLKALERMRAGGSSLVANCGYGRGFSVLDVLHHVKQASGVDFPIRIVERRPGDAVSVVADPRTITRELDWQPRYDDLNFIVRTSLDWESRLSRRNTY
ncbi:UDP-glucose 4-epimerase GalE [Sinorhizobium meliloti]|uniref:UDP-glucose 4-epimerase n=1 Tax=Rhizobium meliloti TaxID=382 RepID=A0AAW9TL84_RHIML|nr:UDP-glucose 4-epimerase GalE [Sinorhizobium meliloti]MDE3764895.1 UDP-glucose 4-epimerase GalE [Sinorhizobium meliloti]MDE3778664.1 UDP-glucose 4-epimerase GalE [Sinorhizobium meliloti]MDE3802846.1 UDP-glucose 4-epimerase GalE [Sinorhizobium meliloti]MQW32473.1 UDP-glucose 4-epimerase GalE [Sinorhizobium meliloti]RVE96682.1 UDP-glucose 4-epimerase GalE [Sinorhizobium meliloti]